MPYSPPPLTAPRPARGPRWAAAPALARPVRGYDVPRWASFHQRWGQAFRADSPWRAGPPFELFREITLPPGTYDPEYPRFVWCPRGAWHTFERAVQAAAAFGEPLPAPPPQSAAMRRTAELLWLSRADPGCFAAILLRASLWARQPPAGTDWPPASWPALADVTLLDGRCWERINRLCHAFRDDPDLPHLLPFARHDQGVAVRSLDALLRYLAIEHRMLFSLYRLVYVATPFWAPHERAPQSPVQLSGDRHAWARELARRYCRQRHGDAWGRLSWEARYALVWAQPMYQIAARFQVDNPTIRHACHTLGIKLPTRGHWAAQARAARAAGAGTSG